MSEGYAGKDRGNETDDSDLTSLLDELSEASRQGEFGVPNSESIVGMVVFTEGGEYSREIAITVVEIDTQSGMTVCEDTEGGRYSIPVANLQDPNAIQREAFARYYAKGPRVVLLPPISLN